MINEPPPNGRNGVGWERQAAAIVKAWPALPAALKMGILAMVKASGEGRP